MTVADRAIDHLIGTLPALPPPGVPEVILHTAQGNSGIGRATALEAAGPPYWAYPWAGGIALARYVLDYPEEVRGKAVLDLCAGSGLVGIAAAMAGASTVRFSDVDPVALQAIRINAARNGVNVASLEGDAADIELAGIEVVLAGDAFFSVKVAKRIGDLLARASRAGAVVLVGDPGRRYLPARQLVLLAESRVADFGAAQVLASVYAWRSGN